MPTLLIIGGGLFGSPAASLARLRGFEVKVFDAALPGAASHAAAGLFRPEWAGKKLMGHFAAGLEVLERLHGVGAVELADQEGAKETYLFVPPRLILEQEPIRERVTAIGDGWLEAGETRHEGFVYVAAGVWSGLLVPGLTVTGKAGTAFSFAGEQPGQIRGIARGRQAIAFVRDPGTTHFSDGTAEEAYSNEHEDRTLARAAQLGLTNPIARHHGLRPYTPGGPMFRRLAERTWLATGGRKMGTILGAAFARRLMEELP